MPPENDLFWKWKTIYEELLDPFTGTVHDKYFFHILASQLNYCKKADIPLSIAILNTPNTAGNYPLIRTITDNIRKRLSKKDLLFYNGRQTFLFILPMTNKEGTKKLADDIATVLAVKGGYAEYPTDAGDPLELLECANQALAIANQYNNNRIIGYFSERRKKARDPIQIEIRYTAPGSCERLTCSRNISENGIMLSGMPDLVLGEEIKLTFWLQSRITISANTIWNKINIITGKMDIGLCFTSKNDSAKEQIRRFIDNEIPPIVKL